MPPKLTTPVYMAGPEGLKSAPEGVVLPLWQCPQSAIPAHVWEMLDLWWSCYLMGALPVAGGWMDQPWPVRLAFPIFAGQLRLAETLQAQRRAQQGAAAALGQVFGGGEGGPRTGARTRRRPG